MAPEAPEMVGKILQSGYIGQGPKVEEFEERIKNHLNYKHVLTVNAATSGLHLAIHALNSSSPHDEILTTPLTCTASNFPILVNKVNLRWVDIDPETANLDLIDLERKITQHTKAIMVVHWGGYPVDIDELKAIVNRCYDRFGHRPVIIEDCAHAWGSTYKGQHIGTHGNWAVFSFQAIKHLTTVDGGVVLTPDVESYRRIKLLRWYGINREEGRKDFRCENDIAEAGYKMHMNDVCATVGLANFNLALEGVKKHQENAAYYRSALNGIHGIKLLSERSDCKSAYWIFTILADKRDAFITKMAEAGIMASRVHARNDTHSCVSKFRTALPNLDKFSANMVCIPVGWWVTQEDREYIVDTIKKGW
jgi:dTDP-4-amino-4,6-dideoxygalactose transaminase